MSNRVQFTIDALDKTGRAFESVKGKINGITGSVSRLKDSFTKLPVLIGAAFGAAFFKNIGEAASRINDLSVKLGINAEILSSYSLLAGQTGTDIEDIGKAIQMLGKNSVEAAQGTGAAAEAFAKLGIDAAKFKDLPLDQQFATLAEALQGVTNPAERINIAMALMGKSGADMLQVMANGGDAIQQFRAEADRLYITLSQDEVSAIDASFDAWGKLWQVITGLGQHILAFFAPAIEWLANVLTEMLVGAVDIVVGAFNGMKRAFEEVVAWIMRRWGDLLGVIASGQEVLAKLPGEIGAGFEQSAKQMRDAADMFKNIRVEAEKTAEASKKASDILASVKMKSPPKIKPPTAGGAGKGKADNMVTLPWLEAKDNLDKINDYAQDTAIDLQGIFRNALSGIGNDFTSLKDVARNALNSISNQLLQSGINSITGSLFGGGGAGLGGILNGLGQSFSRPSASFVGPMQPFAGWFAEGGTIQPGQWGIVGENGAETIRAGSSPLTVFPNDYTQAGGGSGGTQIVYNIDARGAQKGVEEGIIRALKSIDSSIESRSVMAVANAKRRNPNLF